MTRETRIGLLVGLLFIVMFGLVLSELTGKSASPAQTARTSPPADDLGSYLWTPPAPELNQTPSRDTGLAAIREGSDGPGAAPRGVVEASVVRPHGDDSPIAQDTLADARLADLPAPPPAAVDAVAKPQTYKIQPGDSLIKIARKVYGPENEREYKRIADANKDRIRDQRNLVVGTEIVIPPLPVKAAPAPRGVAPGAEGVRSASAGGDVAALASVASGLNVRVDSPGTAYVPAPPVRTDASTPADTASPAAKKYVVRKGDTLSKIAREMLKTDSKAAVDKLLAANKTKVRDPQNLAIGTELEIPG